MKSTFLTIFGLAAAAVAQSTNQLPQCGQTCASNMVSAEKSRELGCDAGDVSCLCTNSDFIYGLRDCSAAICNDEQAAAVLSYGLEICRRAGVAITTGASGSVSASATGSGAVRTILSTLTESDSTITSALSTISGTATGTDAEDVSVSTYTSVFTNSEGDEVTSTIKEILGGPVLTTFTSGGSTIISTIASETDSASTDSASTDSADAAQLTTFTTDGTKVVRTLVTETASTDSTDSADAAQLTTFTTDGTKVIRTLTTVTTGTESESESVSETVTDASTATEGATDASGTDASASATSSDNAAMAKMTGAPAGVIAAAGLAMLLL
ncbi:hypothetical protein ACHAPA_010360 [Fusarium lateritium]